MKKLLAIILAVILLVSAVSMVTVSGANEKIDHRRLEKYGQVHYYLGEAIKASQRPDATDGKVSEGEYVYSTEFSPNSSKDVASVEEYTGYTDTESVKMYMSHDDEKFYLAFEVKDNVYYPSQDYFMINIGARDGGTTIEGVSRVRYDFKGDATNGVLVGNAVTTGVATFYKNTDGSWGTMPAVNFNTHVGDRSLSWDAERKVITLEAVFDIQAILDCWGNENSIEDAEIYFVPLINMGGAKVAGSSEMQYQGRIAHYFDTSRNSEIKVAFTLDYPEITYWFGWAAQIVHFCERPTGTTQNDNTTTEKTTTAMGHDCTTTSPPSTLDGENTIVVKVPITLDGTTEAESTTTQASATTIDATKGCGSTMSLAALSLIPLCAVVVFNKKKDDK